MSATNIPNPYASPDSTTSYIFTLSVIGGACNALFSEKDTLVITVADSNITANFNVVPQTGMAPLTVNITNSSNSADSCHYSFGDGMDSYSCDSVVHTYDNPGTYTITLFVFNACGWDSATKTVDVLIDAVNEINEINNLKIFPNPYRKKTSISYFLNEKSNVKIEVYNAIGEKVSTIVNENQSGGNYNFDIETAKQKNSSAELNLLLTCQMVRMSLGYAWVFLFFEEEIFKKQFYMGWNWKLLLQTLD